MDIPSKSVPLSQNKENSQIYKSTIETQNQDNFPETFNNVNEQEEPKLEKPEVIKAKKTLDLFNKIIRMMQIIIFLAIISYIYL